MSAARRAMLCPRSGFSFSTGRMGSSRAAMRAGTVAIVWSEIESRAFTSAHSRGAETGAPGSGRTQ